MSTSRSILPVLAKLMAGNIFATVAISTTRPRSPTRASSARAWDGSAAFRPRVSLRICGLDRAARLEGIREEQAQRLAHGKRVGLQHWVVTGGLGFIGSAFVRLILRERDDVRVTVLDAMTYAANPANLASVASDPRYRFVRGDICDAAAVGEAIGEGCDAVLNFAAETHVDRSILAPERFLKTDILGTHVLLEAVRELHVKRFLQVSTDEVYGDVEHGSSAEDHPVRPRSPYAASKAGGDLQVLAYSATFGVPVLITRGSNTYGPYQYPEKLIPLFVTNLIDDTPVPVYGDGRQIRDWLHVDDHARGILHVLEHGKLGEIYNLGGGNSRENLEITKVLLAATGRTWDTHVRHVTDRAGHDRRYSLDAVKAGRLGWKPTIEFERGLRETVEWYRTNEPWWRPIKSGEFREYYKTQYASR
jgi:dTDP-glucose 4,6-dehydratase